MELSKTIEITLFEAASGLADPAEREAFLDRTCQGNDELRTRLDKLLALERRAEEFFDRPAPALPPEVKRLAVLEGVDGDRPEVAAELAHGSALVGHFRLVSRIGEGGCGVVYLAEQLEPVRREVALKVIRLGMDTEAVIERFERERQALSMMEHPNIARVLDAGTTASGRPFFVMELVRGESVMDFCRSQELDLRKRLGLFIRVCNAIQHAHQKGVIHRDIKPSNVLVRVVDGEPMPKVIDFGIAKATAGEPGDAATATRSDQVLGTPAYMSPEQAGGGADVDTRSDIYGLGALLHELLCGQPPFDSKRLVAAGPSEARRILCEEHPPAPSAVRPDKGLVELDWIVAKAMAKDRSRRYETANGLAADVRRFLDGEPVLAGPPRRGYRLGKLIRRNKVTFASGAVAVLALLVGFGVSTRLYVIERRSAAEQARLRKLAETARNNEADLRRLAEYRNFVSEAAVRLRYDDLAGADQLLARIPIAETPDSLEAGDVYNQVADWHLMAGRWQEAADRYASLARAISTADHSDNDLVSRSLLFAATAIGYTGDDEAYERTRSFAIDRFDSTTHPVVAEQVIKVCLLKPADDELMARLEPLGEVVLSGLEREDSQVANNLQLQAWSQFSLALLHYRLGNDHEAARWAQLCLASPRPYQAREVTARILLAMTEYRMGRSETARELVELAAGPVRANPDPIQGSNHDGRGPWYAWVTARILLREAQALVSESE